MVKKREGYKFVILEPAKTRMDNNQCPSCAKPKKEWTRRKDWACCSVECTQNFRDNCTYVGWSDLRIKVLERDNYTCVKCGYQDNTMYKAYQNESGDREMKSYLLEKSSAGERLIGDHIKPIALGGDEWDINNVQTLCISCDKIKTRQDHKDIGKLRRSEKLDAKGQTRLTSIS